MTDPRRTPTGTYRLQLRPEFGFDDAAAVLPYLRDLGVSHVYLSPILQAAPGSTHGYDVVDHSRLNEDLGGAEAFHRMSDTARALGLGVVVDVVPNHMAVPTPASLNAALWSVLRTGPASPYARWFDVDWAAHERALLMPVLGRRIGEVVADGEIVLDRDTEDLGGPVLRYFDHVFPVRPGTEDLPLPELLDRQFYRLAHWRVGDEELNYRRFFDIDTLAGVRVEDEQVFAETHAVLLALVRGGPDPGAADRPPRRARRPARLRPAAVRLDRSVDRRREDPRGRRAAARRLAVCRYDGLRRPPAHRRGARRRPVRARPHRPVHRPDR